MSNIRRRRGTPTVGVQVNIAPDVKALLDEYADLAGVPQWAVIEAAIRSGKPGPNGLPSDWDFATGPVTGDPAQGHPQLDLVGGGAVLRTA